MPNPVSMDRKYIVPPGKFTTKDPCSYIRNRELRYKLPNNRILFSLT
jgi:hypothetical protein